MAVLAGYSMFMSRRDGLELTNLQLNFLVTAGGLDVHLNPASHSAARWISLDDTDSERLDPFTRKIMLCARDQYKESRADGIPCR